MSTPFTCERCGKSGGGRVERPPFPHELGRRIIEEICAICWEDWKRRQMLLINHFGLRMHDPAARDFLYKEVRRYLFAEGGSPTSIDPSQEGSVSWPQS